MNTIAQAGVIKVGHEPIDQDHGDFLDLLGRLETASDGEFAALFPRLYEHTERHFERENQLMRDSAFPAEAEHRGEHLRVLGEFQQFQKRVAKGLIPFARGFVRETLPGWLTLHVATMDSALAAHLRARGEC